MSMGVAQEPASERENDIRSIIYTFPRTCLRLSYFEIVGNPRSIFEDKASGAKDYRPGLKAALDFVTIGDVLVVWKLDRLRISLSHLIEVVDSLKEKGAAFRSLKEGMDTTTPSSELLFHAFGAIAQFERALISERVTAGLKATRNRERIGGKTWCNQF